ncbi:MAG: hypothetical protein HY962_08685 [Ignavibacteriae bacterium]|nr:hypothetical protein [Ignavibacteriota bacterium]
MACIFSRFQRNFLPIVMLIVTTGFSLHAQVSATRSESASPGMDETAGTAVITRHGGPENGYNDLKMQLRYPLPSYAATGIVEDPYPVPFEGYDPEHTRIRWDHAAIMGGALTITITGVHMYQMNAWWKDQRTSFHFTEDAAYALNVDKAGHFLGGAFCSFLGRKSVEWVGVSRGASAAWGSVIGALFELYVEFEDGFARDWGFSPGDAYADLLGAGWMYGQYAVPGMEHFQPKFTYFPSKKYRDGLHHGNAIDDYEGQTYWMAVHIHGLLPASWQRWWPEWLALAFGTSVRDMDNPDKKQRNILIALDYDMTKIIPGESWFMRTFKEALNFLHFPSPAIRISPDFVGYGLYF